MPITLKPPSPPDAGPAASVLALIAAGTAVLTSGDGDIRVGAFPWLMGYAALAPASCPAGVVTAHRHARLRAVAIGGGWTSLSFLGPAVGLFAIGTVSVLGIPEDAVGVLARIPPIAVGFGIISMTPAVWQRLNVTAFVVSGIGTAHPEFIGDASIDGSGREELPKFGLPVLVYAGGRDGVRRAFERAVGRDLAVSVYTDELFTTANDADHRAAVAAVRTEDLSVAGFATAGVGKQVDKVFDKLRYYP